MYSKSLNQTGIFSQEREFVLASIGTSEMKSHKFHAHGGMMRAFTKKSKTGGNPLEQNYRMIESRRLKKIPKIMKSIIIKKVDIKPEFACFSRMSFYFFHYMERWIRH